MHAWRTMLQGMEFEGWTSEGSAHWSLRRQGHLVGETVEGEGWIWAPGQQGNFNLRFRYVATTKSAVAVRTSPGSGVGEGYEIVLRTRDGADSWFGPGSVDGIQPSRGRNVEGARSCQISVLDDRVTVFIDGVKRADIHDRRSLRGAIGFKLGAPGRIEISDLELQVLPDSSPLPPPLEEVMEMASGRFASLMPGPKLEGWRMLWPDDGRWYYEGDVLVGADVTQNSWLFTDRHFRDFIFRLEFKWEEGANGGVIYRYPWPPDTGERPGGPMARAAEVQIIFNENEEPGAMHGPMTVKRGVADPADWNRMTLYCYDDRLAVFLNGVKVTDWHNSVAREGAIGIQSLGDNSVMRYRNMEIKEMPQGFRYP